MCIIIDANVAALVLGKRVDPSFDELAKCLYDPNSGSIKLVTGGKLKAEHERLPSVVASLIRLDQANRIKTIPDLEINQEINMLGTRGKLASDDIHVLALARAAKVGLLCTDDADLIIDFKNKDLIDNPRGKIYNQKAHKLLIREYCK